MASRSLESSIPSCVVGTFRFFLQRKKRASKKKKGIAFSNSHDGVVVKAECCLPKWWGSVLSCVVSTFRFILDRRKGIN